MRKYIIGKDDDLLVPGKRYICSDGECIQIQTYFGDFKGSHDWCSYTGNTIEVVIAMDLPDPKTLD